VKQLLLAAPFVVVTLLAQTHTLTIHDGTVIQPVTKRVGHNLGNVSYFDSGQILKNVIGTENPGFEPLQIRHIYTLTKDGTTTSFTSPDIYDSSAPEYLNYWAGGTVTIVSSEKKGAEVGCTAKIASSTVDHYPERGPIITLATPCPAPFTEGDVVVMTQKTTPTPEAWWKASGNGIWANLTGDGRVYSTTKDLCPGCGSQSLVLETPSSDARAGFTEYFDDLSVKDIVPNNYLKITGDWQIDFDAQAILGGPEVTVSGGRLAPNGFSFPAFTAHVPPEWMHISKVVHVSEVSITDGNPGCVAGGVTTACTGTGPASLAWTVTGGSVKIDNISFKRIDHQNPKNTSIFRDEYVQRFVDSGSGEIRFWQGAMNSETFENWTKPDHERAAVTAGHSSYTTGSGLTLSISDFLDLCQVVQNIGGRPIEPYITIPISFTNDEASKLISFLKPWSAIFPKMHLGYGNEAWNGGSFADQSLAFRSRAPEFYFDYSTRAASLFAAMRANPDFSSKFELVLGFQTGTQNGGDEAIIRAKPDAVELNGYTSLSMSPSSAAAMWAAAKVEPWDDVNNPKSTMSFYQSVNDYSKLNRCGASGTAKCGVNVYEFGNATVETCGMPGQPTCTATNPAITQALEDAITSGAGRAIVDSLQPLLNMWKWGIVDQNLFAMTESFNSGPTNTTASLWGDNVDIGGATNNVRPTFLGLKLINEAIQGKMTDCSFDSTPYIDFPGDRFGNVMAAQREPALFAFCFAEGKARSIILYNIDPARAFTVQFGGDAPAGEIVENGFVATDLNARNEAPFGTRTHLTPAAVKLLPTKRLAGLQSITLQPNSIITLTYKSK